MKYILSILLLLASQSSFAQIIKKPTDMECLVYSVYRESRGSKLPQMRAVIDVIQNRAAESGESICTVLRKKSQFPYFKFGVKKIHDRKFLTMFMNAYTMPSMLPRDFLFFNTKKFKWCGKTKKIEKMYFCKLKEKR